MSYKRSSISLHAHRRVRGSSLRDVVDGRHTARRSSAAFRRSLARRRLSSRLVSSSTTLANFHRPRRLFTRLRAIPTPLTPRALHVHPLPANAAPITLSVRAVKPGVPTGTGMPAPGGVASRPRPRLARERADDDDDDRRHRAVSRDVASRFPHHRRRRDRARVDESIATVPVPSRRRRRFHRVRVIIIVIIVIIVRNDIVVQRETITTVAPVDDTARRHHRRRRRPPRARRRLETSSPSRSIDRR